MWSRVVTNRLCAVFTEDDRRGLLYHSERLLCFKSTPLSVHGTCRLPARNTLNYKPIKRGGGGGEDRIPAHFISEILSCIFLQQEQFSGIVWQKRQIIFKSALMAVPLH